MNRRDAVQRIALLMGGAMVGGTAILTGCKSETGKPTEWTPENIAFLDEVADTILPTTSTPGAKAAKVGQFMTVMVNDCYEEKDQKIFRDGMDKLNKAAKDKYSNDFVKLTPQQRTEFLTVLDKEAKDYAKNAKEGSDAHYFKMMKELTLLGYFTSEIGSTQARRHVPVPGRFDGCIPYKKGDKAFA